MLPNEVFALACRAYYEEQGLIVDETNGQFAHCPYPECMGEKGYYLLWEHHQQQGLLQSKDVGKRCFWVGDVKRWLSSCDPIPDDYFGLWDIYEEFISGKHHPMFGRTGELHPMWGKENPKNKQRMLGEENPFRQRGPLHPAWGRKNPSVSQMMSERVGELNHMWGVTGAAHHSSKKVKVTYPNGETKEFASAREAAEHLECPPKVMCKWSNKGHTPSRGRFKGFTFTFL